MSSPFKLFLFLFIIVFTDRLFFWLWLWQLKNYHFKRFIDHFRTQKGKRLVLNLQNSILVFLIFYLYFTSLIKEEYLSFYFYISWLILVLLFFILLCFKALLNFVKLKTKFPVFTKKSTILVLFSLLLEIITVLLLYPLEEPVIVIFLLVYFLSPILFSLIVFLFQPLTVLQRKRILKKATIKRSNFPNLKVIGIVGSYGKTSTKEYLAHILSNKFKVLKTKEHINAELGIAQTILDKLDSSYEVFVCEIGAYEVGKIKEVAEVIKPDVSVLCGINEQHMATFGSQQNIIKAKFELMESLGKEGIMIINKDSRFTNREVKKESIFCSSQELKNIVVEKEKVSFSFDNVYFSVKAIGRQNIINILLAIKTARKLGMNLEEISYSLKDFTLKEGMSLKTNNINVIDSTYSSNPDGVLADLDYLGFFNGKKIIIMPCLIELGESSKEVHERIGRKIGRVCDFAIVTTKERFKDIERGALESGMQEKNIVFLAKAQDITNIIKKYYGKNNVVLLESRVPKRISL